MPIIVANTFPESFKPVTESLSIIEINMRNLAQHVLIMDLNPTLFSTHL